MKVWISKYALSGGIYELEVKLCEGTTEMVRSIEDSFKYFHGKGRHWHETKEEAIKKAESTRLARIASLKRQIAKLEKLTFS